MTAINTVVDKDIQLVKNARAVYGNYATLDNVMDKLRPELAAAKLLVTQAPDVEGPHKVLRTIVTHVPSGDAVSFATPLVLDKETMQGVGSAITYARRYALVSIFFLDADEDDDGNATQGSVAKTQKPKPVKEEKGTVV